MTIPTIPIPTIPTIPALAREQQLPPATPTTFLWNGAPMAGGTDVAPTITPELLSTGPSSEYSGHGIDKYIRCPQLWAYANLIEPKPFRRMVGANPGMTKGTMGHVGLGHHYQRMWARQHGQNAARWWSPLLAVEVLAESRGPEWERWVPFVQLGLRRYFAPYERERFTVLGVEMVLAMTITVNMPDGRTLQFPVTRSADLVIALPDGRVIIIDHKCRSVVSNDDFRGYAIDGQFLDLQIMGRLVWGDAFAGAFLSIIHWKEASAGVCGEVKFYDDKAWPCPGKPINPAPQALAARIPQLQHAFAERQLHLEAGTDPWNYPKRLSETSCVGKYSACDGIELCTWGPTTAVGHSKLAVAP